MILNDLSVTFIPETVLKHSRKGRPLDKFEYRAYVDDRLCVIACLKEYISRRNSLEGLTSDQLIVTLKKPFKGASTDTMRRWMKDILLINNIVDFSPHSCRAASTSKAKHINIDVDEIIRRGCWRNRKNFHIYYDKEIKEYAPDDIDFNKICRT